MKPPVDLAKYPAMPNDQDWLDLYSTLGSPVAWRALDIKAFYVFGIIHDYCQSVEWLLQYPESWPVAYLPAFSLCASGLELLGRCLNGDDKHIGTSTHNLETGFEWLSQSRPNNASQPGVVTITNHAQYSVDALKSLRHFSVHGQGPKAVPFDIELLDGFPQLIGNAMQRYWDLLQKAPHFCEALANAGVDPLRSDPIHKILTFYQEGVNAGDLFYRFDWQVYK